MLYTNPVDLISLNPHTCGNLSIMSVLSSPFLIFSRLIKVLARRGKVRVSGDHWTLDGDCDSGSWSGWTAQTWILYSLLLLMDSKSLERGSLKNLPGENTSSK